MSPRDLAESNEKLRQDLSKTKKRTTTLEFSPSPTIGKQYNKYQRPKRWY
jgi:hypothetical protein